MEEESQESQEKGIKIGDNYRIKPDTYCIVLEEYGYKNPSPKNLKLAKEQGIELEKSYGLIRTTYHRTLQQVLNEILDNSVNKSDFKNLQQISDIVENLRKDFEEFKDTTSVIGNSVKEVKSKKTKDNK